MQNFVKIIVLNGIDHTFLFRKILIPNSSKFFISAFQKIEDQISFEMKSTENGHWQIVQPAPDWINILETRLSGILIEENA